MLRRSDRNLENIPVGALGLIPLTGCEKLGAKVNDYLVKWRQESAHQYKDDVAFNGYVKDNYIIGAKCPRKRFISFGGCTQLQRNLSNDRQYQPYVTG